MSYYDYMIIFLINFKVDLIFCSGQDVYDNNVDIVVLLLRNLG